MTPADIVKSKSKQVQFMVQNILSHPHILVNLGSDSNARLILTLSFNSFYILSIASFLSSRLAVLIISMGAK